jgi:hypothetical protein
MKAHFKFVSTITLFVVAMSAAAAAQATVADVAREYRKTKSANSRVLTNESLSLRSAQSDSSAASSAVSSDSSKADSKAEKPADDSPEARQKAADEWKSRIEAKKAEIVQLQRELDVAQRENKLRAAAYYGDAGTRLRDSAKYAEEDRKYQSEIANKQAAITAAQQAVDKMRDDARRAGVPAGQIP